jgi:hypothetical protein
MIPSNLNRCRFEILENNKQTRESRAFSVAYNVERWRRGWEGIVGRRRRVATWTYPYTVPPPHGDSGSSRFGCCDTGIAGGSATARSSPTWTAGRAQLPGPLSCTIISMEHLDFGKRTSSSTESPSPTDRDHEHFPNNANSFIIGTAEINTRTLFFLRVFLGFPVRGPRFRSVAACPRFGRCRAVSEVLVLIQSCCVFFKIQ